MPSGRREVGQALGPGPLETDGIHLRGGVPSGAPSKRQVHLCTHAFGRREVGQALGPGPLETGCSLNILPRATRVFFRGGVVKPRGLAAPPLFFCQFQIIAHLAR
jgi:hypothetical protein